MTALYLFLGVTDVLQIVLFANILTVSFLKPREEFLTKHLSTTLGMNAVYNNNKFYGMV